jgi:SH3-like domain-containing protein
MYYPHKLVLGVAAALLAAAPARAVEYRSVAEPAVLYDTPSKQGKALFVVARFTPVEVVVSVEGWTKIRDADGAIAWIEKRALADRRMLIATTRAQARQQADAGSPVVFEAEKDVVLEMVEAGPAGWIKVRHRDGQGGFVRVNQVWGQ